MKGTESGEPVGSLRQTGFDVSVKADFAWASDDVQGETEREGGRERGRGERGRAERRGKTLGCVKMILIV